MATGTRTPGIDTAASSSSRTWGEAQVVVAKVGIGGDLRQHRLDPLHQPFVDPMQTVGSGPAIGVDHHRREEVDHGDLIGLRVLDAVVVGPLCPQELPEPLVGVFNGAATGRRDTDRHGS